MLAVLMMLMGCADKAIERSDVDSDANVCPEDAWTEVCNCTVVLDLTALRSLSDDGTFIDQFEVVFVMVEGSDDASTQGVCSMQLDGLKSGISNASVGSDGFASMDLSPLQDGVVRVDVTHRGAEVRSLFLRSGASFAATSLAVDR